MFRTAFWRLIFFNMDTKAEVNKKLKKGWSYKNGAFTTFNVGFWFIYLFYFNEEILYKKHCAMHVTYNTAVLHRMHSSPSSIDLEPNMGVFYPFVICYILRVVGIHCLHRKNEIVFFRPRSWNWNWGLFDLVRNSI